jgi:hypothetical protein
MNERGLQFIIFYFSYNSMAIFGVLAISMSPGTIFPVFKLGLCSGISSSDSHLHNYYTSIQQVVLFPLVGLMFGIFPERANWKAVVKQL